MSTWFRGRRSGFVLALLLVIGSILFIGLLAIYQWMRDENLRTHRYQEGELAFHLAVSGAGATFRYLESELNRPGAPVRGRLLDLSGPAPALLSPTVTKGLTLSDRDLDTARAIPEVLALARGLGADPGEIRIQAVFFGFKPLRTQAFLGIAPEPMEGSLLVRVRCRVRHRRVEKVVQGQGRARIASITAPLFSKFTLVVAGQPDRDVVGVPGLSRLTFELGADRERPETIRDLGTGAREPATPLVLVNHPDARPWRNDARLREALGPRFMPDPALLPRSGLVYLGAESKSSEWLFNLASDGFLDRPAVKHTQAFEYRLFPYPADIPREPGSFKDAFQEATGFYSGVFEDAVFFGTRRFSLENPPGFPVTDGTSWLRPFGDQTAVSPTLVLGAASRRYLRYSYMSDGGSPLFLDYFPDEKTWLAESPLVELFEKDYGRYSKEMATVVVEPLNRSLDYVLSSRERQTGTDPGGYMQFVAGTDPPTPPVPDLTLGKILGEPGEAPRKETFLYPVRSLSPIRKAEGYRLTDIDLARGEKSIFSGDLRKLLEEGRRESAYTGYCDLIRQKAGRWVKDQAALASLCGRREAPGELTLPGVVEVREGPLEIGPGKIRKGGLILVNGNVTLTGPLTAEGAETLTIVSRTGSVTVKGLAPVRAAVVALAGKLKAPGGMDLAGGLAVQEVDVGPSIRGGEPRKITYDPALDPTDPLPAPCGEVPARAALRITLEEGVLWATGE